MAGCKPSRPRTQGAPIPAGIGATEDDGMRSVCGPTDTQPHLRPRPLPSGAGRSAGVWPSGQTPVCCRPPGSDRGPELDAAVRSGRALVGLARDRESGYRVLMQAVAAQGNVAAALEIYDLLRCRLRDDLGIAPGPVTPDLYGRLLG